MRAKPRESWVAGTLRPGRGGRSDVAWSDVTRLRAHGALLQRGGVLGGHPDGIPERVVGDPLDEAGTKRVGDDVAGDRSQILVGTDCMIVVCTIPQGTFAAQRPVHPPGTAGLERPHRNMQRLRRQGWLTLLQ